MKSKIYTVSVGRNLSETLKKFEKSLSSKEEITSVQVVKEEIVITTNLTEGRLLLDIVSRKGGVL